MTRLALLGELPHLLRHLLPPLLRFARSIERHQERSSPPFSTPRAVHGSTTSRRARPGPQTRVRPRLRQLRNVEADEVPIVGRVDPEVAHLDRALDVLERSLVERLDHDLRGG